MVSKKDAEEETIRMMDLIEEIPGSPVVKVNAMLNVLVANAAGARQHAPPGYTKGIAAALRSVANTWEHGKLPELIMEQFPSKDVN